MSLTTPNTERREPWLSCADCRLPYSDDGWCDCVVPDDVWEQINPSKEHGGVLCLHCMARRIHRLGLDGVPLKVTSGPFSQEAWVDHLQGERNALREENARLRALSGGLV
jgi:hypothetical protein